MHSKQVGGFVPLAIAAMAVVILLILVVADLFNARVAAESTRTYHTLRQAMTTHDTVVRLQLDEETGIRGYVATGDALLLSPYFAARSRMPGVLAAQHDQIAAVGGPALESRATRLAALNALWEQTIARPSLLARPPSRAAKLQIRGRPIIEAFRRESAQLDAVLNARSDSLLDALFAKLREVSEISLALVVLVALASIAWLRHQNRLRIVYASAERQIESLQRVADAFHRAQLPRALPSSPQLSFDATYVPAEEVAVVGGDWYDVFTLDGQRYVFSMGDVTGHGLEAAILTSRVRQTISTLASIENDPAAILERANALLRKRDDLIVSALCGSIDARDGAIAFASAGHPPVLIVTPEGTIRELSSGAPPLGVTERLDVVARRDTLLAGELLVCYTDGIIENERNVVEGEARLRQVLTSLRSAQRADRPAAAIGNRILGARRGRDDVAILTILRSSAPVGQAGSAAGALPAMAESPV
ncbi:MAG TPA: SpoIIE family protein phosphatase [Candidatus Cybelea sp.]|jgi:serine phosphatase RsbU (regulator of sigma subunit)|nr:SpoIIE family protein phosphatase [Candidatus Cybelea sp.]